MKEGLSVWVGLEWRFGGHVLGLCTYICDRGVEGRLGCVVFGSEEAVHGGCLGGGFWLSLSVAGEKYLECRFSTESEICPWPL